MTKQEREIRDAQRQIARTQKEISETEYKQRARFKALEVAQYLRPPAEYISNSASLVPQQKISPPYDVTANAEKIYQWLIKVFK